MNGWMNGWMDGCMHGWTDVCMDGRMHGWTDVCVDGRTYARMDGGMFGWRDNGLVSQAGFESWYHERLQWVCNIRKEPSYPHIQLTELYQLAEAQASSVGTHAPISVEAAQ